MQCEALDKLEEFTLFIRHYFCLLGVATLLSHGRCVIAPPRLAPEGLPVSLMAEPLLLGRTQCRVCEPSG